MNSATLFRRRRYLISAAIQKLIIRSVSTQPLFSSPSNPTPRVDPTKPNPSFSKIANLFTTHRLAPGPDFESALDQTGIEPGSDLLLNVFENFDCSPKLLYALYLWAVRTKGFRPSKEVFDTIVNVLSKAREFDSAWLLVLNQIDGSESGCRGLVSVETFAVLIRRYCRAKMPKAAIRTYEYVCGLNGADDIDSGEELFEILLDSLCKEGHVRVGSEYFDRRRRSEPSWIPSVRVYNILLNGWFRSRKLKHAERLWMEMKRDNVKPSVVTYGTLVEGYCRMRRAERANELVDEMRKEGIEPNAIVYNPIIDAFGEERRFEEALSLLERFLPYESGPTLSTYNSLVKGFCKAGDLMGASNIVKMMINREFVPTATTYNYFFKYFSKYGKIEDGMNLYFKMVISGHNPDRLSYHLLLKMLCEGERLNLAVQVSKEMRARGFDMDLATSTMLLHLLIRMQRLEDAFAEFEDMIRKGIVPQYLTYQRLSKELKKGGMIDLVRKLDNMMAFFPHSTKLPNTYIGDEDVSRSRRKYIMHKAEKIADTLKTCKDPRKLVQHRYPSENAVYDANRLMEDLKRRANG